MEKQEKLCLIFLERYGILLIGIIPINNFDDVAIKLNKDNIPTFLTSRIDYCFEDTNLNLKSYEVDNVYMSDDFPIVVDFS